MKASRICRSLGSIVELPITGFKIPSNSLIFSAIQPTGVFHLGNYLGAVRSWVDLAREAPESTRIFYAIADLHAITIPKDPAQLLSWRRDALASILATGVDPERCVVYYQSTVSEHAELSWILSTMTGMGQLSRMVQWKSKANFNPSASLDKMDEKALSSLQLGLFAYPVLQAADILIHKAALVPVGDDQSQHLELTRTIAEIFNRRYKSSNGKNPIFPMPSTIFAPYKKILSLRDPLKKMSKSDPDQRGVVYITDSPEDIKRKVRSAVTDSIQGPVVYDPVNRPGVSNLLLMASGLLKLNPEEFTSSHLSHIKDHKQLKDYISDILIEQLSGVRDSFLRLKQDPQYLETISEKGTSKAKESAIITINEVKKVMGF